MSEIGTSAPKCVVYSAVHFLVIDEESQFILVSHHLFYLLLISVFLGVTFCDVSV